MEVQDGTRLVEHGFVLVDVQGSWPNGWRAFVFPMVGFTSIEVRANWRLGPHEVMSFGIHGRADDRDSASWVDLALASRFRGTAPGVFRKNGDSVLNVSSYLYEARVVLFKRFGSGVSNDIRVFVTKRSDDGS